VKESIQILTLFLITTLSFAQKKTVSQIKAELEKSSNPVLHTRNVLKKKFRIDTVAVLRIGGYQHITDSLAYHGKVGKVYGPYDKGKVLVQILGKAPNTFNRISQIFLDTAIFRKRFADSLANDIILKIKNGTSTFEELAQIYSMGGEGTTKGDLGWIAAGSMIMQIERELVKRKKGEIFKVWTKNGVHIIRKSENSKRDNGFALMLTIFL
jgi:peptidyl-prolyl cis-trans isomerase C